MATPWDRPANEYVAEWLPRFTPYHHDLVEELTLAPGQHVLVPCCGFGSEVMSVAREVGSSGIVRATDAHEALVRICRARLIEADLPNVPVACRPAEDVAGGPWDAILCAFGLWQLDHRTEVLRAWRSALSQHGKVGVLTWGPPEESDPIELMTKCLKDLEPDAVMVTPRILSSRDSMEAMFDEAGLVLVRHTVVRHTLAFVTAEAFVKSLRHARGWDEVWSHLGEHRMGLVAARFYDGVGGPTAPLPWDPPATLAIAALPGAEIALRSRPSVVVPKR
jgi:protein-L-isoaspartate O-methyltransferase